jgi:hypothetical protein
MLGVRAPAHRRKHAHAEGIGRHALISGAMRMRMEWLHPGAVMPHDHLLLAVGLPLSHHDCAERATQ